MQDRYAALDTSASQAQAGWRPADRRAAFRHRLLGAWRRHVARLGDDLDRLAATRWPTAWLAVICLLLFVPGFFSIPLLDPTESRVAAATLQMLQGGDFIHLRLGDQEMGDPIGIHWVQAAVVRGLEILRLAHRSGLGAYRLTSLLAALAAVLATYRGGQALVGRPAAFLGAAMLAGCAALVAAAHVATADAAILALSTISMGLLGAAYLRPRTFATWQAAGFWLAIGAGGLLQGWAALFLPLLAAITLAVADRGAAWLSALQPQWGMFLLLAGMAGFHAAIGLPPMALATPGLHLLTIAAAAFPAAWIVLPALPEAWKARRESPVRLLLAWAVAAWLTVEATADLPYGSLPALPPLMLLAARWALDPQRILPPRWLAALGCAALAGVAGAVAIGASAVALIDLREAPYGLLACAGAAALVWRLLAEARPGNWARAALLGTLLAAPLYAAVLAGTFAHLPVARIAQRIAGAAQRVAPGLAAGNFGVAGFDAASLRFTYGVQLRQFTNGGDAARFLAAGPDRLVAVANGEEMAFHSTARALELAPREVGSVLSFDPLRLGYVVMLFFRLAPPAAEGGT